MQAKISMARTQAVLAQVPSEMRKMAAENRELRARVDEYERRGRLSKLASKMADKGIEPDLSHDELMAKLATQAGDEHRLQVIEEAVDMATSGVKLGSLATDDRPGNGATELEAYLLGG